LFKFIGNNEDDRVGVGVEGRKLREFVTTRVGVGVEGRKLREFVTTKQSSDCQMS